MPSLASALSLAAQQDIPSGPELTSLSDALQERKGSIVQRRSNAEADRRHVLGGHVRPADLGKISLSELYDQSASEAERNRDASSRSMRDSPAMSPTSKPRAPSSSAKSQGRARASALPSSPPPASSTQSQGQGQAIGTPGGSGPGRPRIKVKHESERDRDASAASRKAKRDHDGASSGADVDYDEEGGPRRAFQRKRQRTASAFDNDSDMSLSEAESPEPGSLLLDSQRPGLPNVGSGLLSSTKLKLNPTTQTLPNRRESIGNSLLRKASGVRTDVPLTPYQAQLAAQWELPRRTVANIIPQRTPTRPHRAYPTKPDEVDVDFSAMDWRERDKERDRTESGPGAGQAVVKESATSGRARDRKQDQVPLHVFQQWADGWFRTLTEEDLAWFSSKSNDPEPFQMPALGRHYTDVWAEEEALELPTQTVYLPGPSATIPPFHAARTMQTSSGAGSAANGTAAQSHEASRFDPRKLRDENLTTSAADDARAGPITERLLAAVLPQPPAAPQANGHAPNAQTSNGGLVLMSGHGSGSAGPSQDLSMYEQRLAEELKSIEILGKDQKIDWSERTDDEVSVALRKVQSLLREQTQQNEQRKGVLFHIAADRMAHQEYLGCLASVEREIESGWLKRQTQIKKSMQAQKKKKGSTGSNTAASSTAAGSGAATTGSPAPGTPGGAAMAASASTQGASTPNVALPTSATHAAGGGPIKPQFSEALIGAMQRRLQLKFAIEPLFANKPWAKYTPTESVFSGLKERSQAHEQEAGTSNGAEANTSNLVNGHCSPHAQ